MIEVKQATFEDMTALREVAIKTFTDTFSTVNTPENMAAFLKESYSLTNFEKEFHEVGSYLYLAWVDIQLAGFLRLRRSLEVNDKLGSNTIELHRLYVLEDFQNQKVGKVLMEKALGLAKEIMVDWIWLGVWEHNSKAQKFYTRWGFEKFGEHVFHMGDDPQTDWLLKRSM
ncbi:MAG: GNAT family N-acetyltransferase [Bacteroidia bacterium]|nr:GNAT family N-acetyltransferase [Bacteroidia bacterium]